MNIELWFIYVHPNVSADQPEDQEAIPPLPLFSSASGSTGHSLEDASMNMSAAHIEDIEHPQTDVSDSETESVPSG